MDNLSQIVWFLGGWSVIVIAVIAFIARNLTNKLTLNWELENQKQIEFIKSELSKNQTITNNLLNAYSTGFNIAQEKRIEAIEQLWNSVLQAKRSDSASSTSFIYNILKEDEIENIYNDPSGGAQKIKVFLDKINPIEFASNTYKSSRKVDYQRPFIGDSLYSFFQLYIKFSGRVQHLLIKDREKEIVTVWKKDQPLINTLKEMLSDEEMDYILSQDFNSYNVATSLIEQKIINGGNRIISGELAMDGSLSQLDKLNKLLDIKLK